MYAMGPEKILGNLLFCGKLCALCEVVATSRSGSFFFKSTDGRFFVKTLPLDEFSLLIKSLAGYTKYLNSNPDTFLTRYYGGHVIMKKADKKEMRFVVMQNIFNPNVPVHEQYDLKGSTVDRFVEIEAEDEKSKIAMKDQNLKRKLHVGAKMKAMVMEQLEKDTRWLANLNICDYSLLVGIHHIDSSNPTTQHVRKKRRRTNSSSSTSASSAAPPASAFARSVFQQDLGGIVSVDRTEIYYFGLIDTLTLYNLKKMSERLAKVTLYFYEAEKISAMPALKYQIRFQKYIDSILA
eukprot:TRINITY_DN9378_c0_g1_i2.p2 TRINITY_DN9378_c0_g1~~TRINITY_DN9378_c0_g1_i2.p2  ORF type:complete len:294 (+),score=56.67 TRINITY_DN9378_c0_g1_i2:1131-2012(+)